MAFLFQYDETTVIPYLAALDLSRQGRVVLASALHDELRLHGDAYINDPERRFAPGSDLFHFDLIFRDPVRRVVHDLRLIISDAAAQYGVLRVVYAEDAAWAPIAKQPVIDEAPGRSQNAQRLRIAPQAL